MDLNIESILKYQNKPARQFYSDESDGFLFESVYVEIRRTPQKASTG